MHHPSPFLGYLHELETIDVIMIPAQTHVKSVDQKECNKITLNCIVHVEPALE